MSAGGGVLAVLDEALKRLHEAHNAAAGKQRDVFAEAHGNLAEARATVEAMADALRNIREHARVTCMTLSRAWIDATAGEALAAYRGEAAFNATPNHPETPDSSFSATPSGDGDAVLVSRARLGEVRNALDRQLGDTDPFFPIDTPDEEVRDEEPIFWACQQISAMLDGRACRPASTGSAPAPSSDTKRLDWLEAMARNGGIFLYNGVDVVAEKRSAVGIALRPGRMDRALREAIDTAMSAAPTEPRR